MADRTSHVFEGAGSALVTTYTAAATAVTAALPTGPYDKLLVYLSVSGLAGSGKASMTLESSLDGDSWFTQKTITSSTAASTINGVLIDATGDHAFTFSNVGSFCRVKIEYVSGTSVTVDLCHIEAKS